MEEGVLLEFGRGWIICEGLKIVVLSFGMYLFEVFIVVEELEVYGFLIIVVDVRFCKFLDIDFVE